MNRPLLLGHRGARASRHIPENTLASFELSLRHGCDGFEFDVRRSADGDAVICHDPMTRSLEIENTLAQVLALPTLEQILEQFSSRAFLDIELKVTGLEQQLIAALREHPPIKGYVVSSFLAEALSAVHAVDTTVPLGFLWDEGNKTPPKSPPIAWLIPRVDWADPKLVEQAHADGKKVMVWTVNRGDEMRRMSEWDVDAIISDETDLLVRSFR
ncbi:MAG: glycerophosphodiester phosphodiesterase [Terriglobales bacterium]